MLTTALTANLQKQMRIATDLSRQLPFGSSGYGWRDVDTCPNIVGFDCTKCPVAAFFEGHSATDLFVQTCCALDFPRARKGAGRSP